MEDLLKCYIHEVLSQLRSGKSNHGLSSQLISPRKTIKSNDSDDDTDESSGAGAIAGFTAPLGYSSSDLQPVGHRRGRKNKKSHVRFK